MFFAGRHFFDPLARSLGAAPREASAPFDRHMWPLAAGITISCAILADTLREFTQENILAVVLMVGMSILLVGGVTLGWALGARSRLPLSAIFGGLAAATINGGATYFILLAQNREATLASSGLEVGFAGFLGGLAVDMSICGRPSLCAPTCALIGLVLAGLAGVWSGSIALTDMIPNIVLGLGWILGCISVKGADQVLSRPKREASVSRI